MIFLQIISYVFLIMAIASLVYTAIQIHDRVLIRKLQEELVEKIINLFQQQKNEYQITVILVGEGYLEEEVRLRIKELKELM